MRRGGARRDIDIGVKGIEWTAGTFTKPVIYVLGNHEYYDEDAARLLPRARSCASELGIHLLEHDEVTLDGVRFLGCTLWDGFDAGPFNSVNSADVAHQKVADFSAIRDQGRLLTPSTIMEWHRRSRAWLEVSLGSQRPAVVVAHFPLSLRTLNPRFGLVN